MKKNIIVLLVGLSLFGFAANAQKVEVKTSNKAGWSKIAELTVDIKKTDHDVVTVMGKDHFKAIKLKVTDATVEFDKVTVTFENDTQQEIPVAAMIKEGGETRSFDIEEKGRELAIKNIALTYKTVPNAEHDKAHVEIWGMK